MIQEQTKTETVSIETFEVPFTKKISLLLQMIVKGSLPTTDLQKLFKDYDISAIVWQCLIEKDGTTETVFCPGERVTLLSPLITKSVTIALVSSKKGFRDVIKETARKLLLELEK